MEHDRWTRIHELFNEALELEPHARAAFLNTAAAGDDALREQVETLLRAHDKNVPILDGGPELLATVLNDEIADAPPSRIGPYRVVRELGRGGMGVVYLAERDDADFRQTVALKCLLPGIAGADVVARFRRERRILAGLVHPNIAQLHDGGVTATGEPYLVMEWVDGEPLDGYCDRHRLTVGARLLLFIAVCEAVQYAHQHLVVHRDLKPGNVLVTGDGHVKLLDFGVAKLLDPESPQEPALTRTSHALTPTYASPEQLRGDPATAASDVYSLGMILFELLTGSRAFTISPGPLGPLRAALETEPRRASAAVAPRTRTDATEAVADMAAARSTTPERLQRRLRGDLDTILERALRRNAAERYPSVQALLDDVRRHIDGQPIHARPPSSLYRARKFAARHRTSVAAAALALLALVGGLGAATWQGAVAARERDAAREEAEKAARVTNFLVSTFAAANPYAPSAERLDTFRVASLLRRGADRVRTELAADSAVQIPLLRALGRTYRLLPDLESATPLLEDAVALSRAVYGAEHPELAESLTEQAHLLVGLARPSDAEPLFREALAIRRAAFGDQHPSVTRSLSVLGQLLLRRGRIEEADSLMALAAARARAELTPDSALLADILTRQAMLANARGDLDAAISTAREAHALNVALLGAAHPRSIGDLNNVAVFLQRAGRHVDAEAAYRQALTLQRQALGETHPFVVTFMATHANALSRIGSTDEARRGFLDAIRLSPSVQPRTAAFVRQSYAAFLQSHGENTEAEKWYRDAIRTLEASSSDEDRDIGLYKSALARLLCTTGRPRPGAALYREALHLFERIFPADHRDVQRTREALAACT